MFAFARAGPRRTSGVAGGICRTGVRTGVAGWSSGDAKFASLREDLLRGVDTRELLDGVGVDFSAARKRFGVDGGGFFDGAGVGSFAAHERFRLGVAGPPAACRGFEVLGGVPVGVVATGGVDTPSDPV